MLRGSNVAVILYCSGFHIFRLFHAMNCICCILPNFIVSIKCCEVKFSWTAATVLFIVLHNSLMLSGVRRKFHVGGWFRVIWWSFVFGVLFVTSQFNVISMFPNQRFGEVCWHNNVYFSTSTPLTLCDIALNISYQRSKLGYRRKINSTLRHSSS